MLSNSKRLKSKKFKQQWQQRNWSELPSDIMVNILLRVDVFVLLETAEKVCTAWREICKDPALWTVIYMNNLSDQRDRLVCKEMCKQAVDRSQGQLDYLMIGCFCDPELLQSSQLGYLEIVFGFNKLYGKWKEAFKKLSLLEELVLYVTSISQEDIEAAGRYCPLLKTLKVHKRAFLYRDGNEDNEIALSIGKNLPQLTHLELTGSNIKNNGLQAILDGCCHLESLDLRGCDYLDLSGDLGKRCSQQIKYLKLPRQFLEGHVRYYPHR